MKDILNRELHDYDLVIGMIISRYSDGLRYGVWQGNSVVWQNGIKSNVTNIYLVESPNEEEIVIRDKITERIKKEAKEKERIEYISAKEIKIGNIYETLGGVQYAYLGKGHLSIKGTEEISRDGYLYFLVYPWENSSIKSMSFSEPAYIENLFLCVKTKKKFVKDIKKSIDIVDNPCVLVEEYEHGFGVMRKKKISVTVTMKEM